MFVSLVLRRFIELKSGCGFCVATNWAFVIWTVVKCVYFGWVSPPYISNNSWPLAVSELFSGLCSDGCEEKRVFRRYQCKTFTPWWKHYFTARWNNGKDEHLVLSGLVLKCRPWVVGGNRGLVLTAKSHQNAASLSVTCCDGPRGPGNDRLVSGA